MRDTKKGRERLIRRLLPSTVMLTKHKATAAPLDFVAHLAGQPFSEFRYLPPNRLRVRVGVGNRVFLNHAQFLRQGADTCIRLFANGHLRPDSNIVDIGAGCGKLAYSLKASGVFRGLYTGTDVDSEMVDWCQEHLADEHFQFVHADIYSGLYNPGGSRDPYMLPLADDSQDLVISQSLFTHLLEADVERYVNESFRVLRPGGQMLHGVFCLDDQRARGLIGGRWTFAHSLGSAHVENPAHPEAAVAYDKEYLETGGIKAGFTHVEVQPFREKSLLFAIK